MVANYYTQQGKISVYLTRDVFAIAFHPDQTGYAAQRLRNVFFYEDML